MFWSCLSPHDSVVRYGSAGVCLVSLAGLCYILGAQVLGMIQKGLGWDKWAVCECPLLWKAHLVCLHSPASIWVWAAEMTRPGKGHCHFHHVYWPKQIKIHNPSQFQRWRNKLYLCTEGASHSHCQTANRQRIGANSANSLPSTWVNFNSVMFYFCIPHLKLNDLREKS